MDDYCKSERSSNTTKIETQYGKRKISSMSSQKEVLTQQRLKPMRAYKYEALIDVRKKF